MNTIAPAASDHVNDFLWVSIPTSVGKRSRTLGAIMADGIYLTAFPWFAASAPLVAFAVGIAIGSIQPGYQYEIVYTASLTVMLLMIIVGTASGAIGAWLWLGFMVADFFLASHWPPFRYESAPLRHILQHRLPLLVPDAFLAVLMLYLPLVSRVLSIRAAAKFPVSGRSGLVVRVIAQAVIFAALVRGWAYLAPLLVRPVYTWSGGSPTAGVIEPVQKYGWVLALTGGTLIAIRCVAENSWIKRPAVVTRAVAVRSALLKSAAAASPRRPLWVTMAVRSALLLVVLSGVTSTLLEAAALGGVLFLLLIARARASLTATWWGRTVGRIPVVVRFGLAVAINYVIATQVISSLWYTPQGLRPVLISMVLALIVFWLLIPASSAIRKPAAAAAEH